MDRAVVGGTLLQVLDRVAFEVLPESGNVSTENISKSRILYIHRAAACLWQDIKVASWTLEFRSEAI